MHIAALLLENFCRIYADYLPENTVEELRTKDGAVEQLDFIYQVCARVGQRIYLFIDECDHFTNTILSSAERFRCYTDETHGEGHLQAFFNKVKAGTYSSIERRFITGVSLVTTDDLTSHFNHTVDELLEIMKPWYNNYCYARRQRVSPRCFHHSDLGEPGLNHRRFERQLSCRHNYQL